MKRSSDEKHLSLWDLNGGLALLKELWNSYKVFCTTYPVWADVVKGKKATGLRGRGTNVRGGRKFWVCLCLWKRNQSQVGAPLQSALSLCISVFLWPKLSTHLANVESCWIQWICSYCLLLLLFTKPKYVLFTGFLKCNKDLFNIAAIQIFTFSSVTCPWFLGQSMLEVYIVPKQNDTIQKMTQSSKWFNSTINSLINSFLHSSCNFSTVLVSVTSQKLPIGNCTLLCAIPWLRVDSYSYHSNLVCPSCGSLIKRVLNL